MFTSCFCISYFILEFKISKQEKKGHVRVSEVHTLEDPSCLGVGGGEGGSGGG